MRAGAEPIVTCDPESIAFELDRKAVAAGVVEIEEQVSHRAGLDAANQLGHLPAVTGRNRRDLGDLEFALPNELAGPVFGGKGQHICPRGAGLLEHDQRAGRIKQEMKFLGVGHGSGAFHFKRTRADGSRALADQGRIGMVVLTAKAQE
jgi:hypothetical protein